MTITEAYKREQEIAERYDAAKKVDNAAGMREVKNDYKTFTQDMEQRAATLSMFIIYTVRHTDVATNISTSMA